MNYTLLIGNNFISNNPKLVKFNHSQIFSIDIDNEGPHITTDIYDLTGTKIIEVLKNNVKFCKPELKAKFKDRNHILIVDNNGEIILESRVLKDTIIVSGRFVIGKAVITITQNYISLANGKRIMHSKVNSDNKSISITENGIKLNE